MHFHETLKALVKKNTEYVLLKQRSQLQSKSLQLLKWRSVLVCSSSFLNFCLLSEWLVLFERGSVGNILDCHDTVGGFHEPAPAFYRKGLPSPPNSLTGRGLRSVTTSLSWVEAEGSRGRQTISWLIGQPGLLQIGTKREVKTLFDHILTCFYPFNLYLEEDQRSTLGR